MSHKQIILTTPTSRISIETVNGKEVKASAPALVGQPELVARAIASDRLRLTSRQHPIIQTTIHD